MGSEMCIRDRRDYDSIRQGVLDEMLDTAFAIYERARELVPVDTGALKQSIRVEAANKAKLEIAAGGGQVDYAPYVESRAHFMTQAFDEKGPGIIRRARRRIRL